MLCSANSTAISARKKVPHETPNRWLARRAIAVPPTRFPTESSSFGCNGVQFRRQAQKPYYIAPLWPSLSPAGLPGSVISSRLYCNPKALWKLDWFLRDFGYDTEMLGPRRGG